MRLKIIIWFADGSNEQVYTVLTHTHKIHIQTHIAAVEILLVGREIHDDSERTYVKRIQVTCSVQPKDVG